MVHLRAVQLLEYLIEEWDTSNDTLILSACSLKASSYPGSYLALAQ